MGYMPLFVIIGGVGMNVRNRMADVAKLRCNVCQDFLEMVITPGWQQKLYNKAKDAVENKKYADNYIAAYEKMRNYGIDKYKIVDMDVSIIIQIVRFCKEIVTVKSLTKDAIIKLKEDRNENDHSTHNEKDEELYLRGLLALCDIRDFIRTVDRYEDSIPDEKRREFREKYIYMLDELQDTLDDERISLIQSRKEMIKDIKKIIESSDSDSTWTEINGLYLNRFMKVNKNIDSYNQFLFEAAEAGVEQAYSALADSYYIREKYDDAEYYLHLLYQLKDRNRHDVHSMMCLADIYFKGLSKRTGDGHEVIKKLISEGYNIIKSEDGKRYELISKSPVMKGKCLHSIDIPAEESDI